MTVRVDVATLVHYACLVQLVCGSLLLFLLDI